MNQTKHTPATPRNIAAFGVGYGFIVDAASDGSITLNAKALAKIEPGADDAIIEMQRRANAYPRLVELLKRLRSENPEDGMIERVLRDLGEAE